MSRLRPRRLPQHNRDSCGDSASAWRRWRINKPKLTGEKVSITVRLALGWGVRGLLAPRRQCGRTLEGFSSSAASCRAPKQGNVQMKRILLALAALAATATVGARADVVGIQLGGAGTGISGTVVLSYGPASDSKYPGQGFEITAVSGTFSDATLGIFDAPIASLVPILPTPPLDPPPNPNLLAPHDFSHFAVANGLPSDNHGFLTYDNLFWPDGAPPTASAFDGAGGFLDIYGLMFGIGNGIFVDLFNNGVGAFSGIDYGGFGAAVATHDTRLDYVAGGVTATAPEPSTWAMMILGFAGLAFAGYRTSRKAAAVAA
jgi:hypothetical protein